MLSAEISFVLAQLEKVLEHDISAPYGDCKLVSNRELAEELLRYTRHNLVDSVVYKLDRLSSITAQEFLDKLKKASNPPKALAARPVVTGSAEVTPPAKAQGKALTAEPADTSPLTEDEATKLSLCETFIGGGLKCMEEATAAIKQIKDERLYRNNYASFSAYCTKRWKSSSRRIHQLIGTSETADGLDRYSEVTVKPSRNSQLRELKKIGNEVKQAEAWDRAVEMSGGEQPTTKEVIAAVDAVKHQTIAAGGCSSSIVTEDLTARQKRVTADLLFQLQGVLMFNDDAAFFRKLKSDLIIPINWKLKELGCAG